MGAGVGGRRLVEGGRGLLAWIGLLGDDPDADLAEVVGAWDAGQFELAESLAQGTLDPESAEMPPELRERLEALGYLN